MAKMLQRQPLQTIAHVLVPQEHHWVGDGFFVSTVFSPFHLDADVLSPFILLDYAAPKYFEPSPYRRGVGEHPHRGFETVTFAYQGEVAHRDSHGGGGTITTGGVQWMTAAAGVVHEEKHSASFSEKGGVFEMVQLWVNLPAAVKMGEPRYQAIEDKAFPRISFGDVQGRLIAGRFQDQQGPAKTHSPIIMFDMGFDRDETAEFQLDPGTTTLILVRGGKATIQNATTVEAGAVVVMDRASVGAVSVAGEAGTAVLVLNGEPLNEPVVAHGPFVMNTREEIIQAMRDYEQGKMGRLRPQV